MFRRFGRKLLLISGGAFLVLLAGFCSVAIFVGLAVPGGKRAAEQAVQQFHVRYNLSQYESIYSDTDDEFRSVSSEAEFLKFMASVRAKLGELHESTLGGWRVDKGTFGTVANVQYESRFANGMATESFTWLVTEGSAKLRGYNVRSPSFALE